MRNIIEYKLALTQEQIDRLLYAVMELQGIHITYILMGKTEEEVHISVLR